VRVPIPLLILIATAVACTKGDDSGTPSYGNRSESNVLNLDPDTGTDGGSGELGDCNSIETNINGRSGDDVTDPKVGDQWIVRMYCDGALLTGANRLFFQPATVAVVDDVSTDATFVAQGQSKMTMQSGNFVYTKNITVGPAE